MGESPVVVNETPVSGVDMRDILDRGRSAARAPRPDVVVTRDPIAVAYAANRADFFIVDLPYDRTYFLVAIDSSSAIPSQAERDALARDAVTADARGAAPPFAWLDDPGCVLLTPLPHAAPQSIVAYAAGDAIAKQLAERIVALAGVRGRPRWLPASVVSGVAMPRTAAIAADSIQDALTGGRVAAAVIVLPRDSIAGCATRAPTAPRSIPLIESRAHAIVRRGSGAAFIVNANGRLRFIRRGAP
jgi:hypothetical protein